MRTMYLYQIVISSMKQWTIAVTSLNIYTIEEISLRDCHKSYFQLSSLLTLDPINKN